MKYGRGHIPNAASVLRGKMAALGLASMTERPIGELLQRYASASPLPDSESLLPFIGTVNDQGATSSCVAQAGTKAIFVRGRKMGLSIPELSAQASYALTRGVSTAPGAPLVDEGSIPIDFFITASTFGVVAASRLPLDPSTINDRLPLDVFEAGSDAKVASFHLIETVDDARCEEIRNCIHAGVPVTFAMGVDRSFEGLSDQSVYQGPTGPILGGHDQLIIGYGPGYFEVLGSWGANFGYGGLVRIASSFIGSMDVLDLCAADVAPLGVA